MHSFVAALAALLLLSLPLVAQAGDGCPYSKQDTTTAALDAPIDEAGACATACGHGGATAEPGAGECSCSDDVVAAHGSSDGDVAHAGFGGQLKLPDGTYHSMIMDAVPLRDGLVAILLTDVTQPDSLLRALDARTRCRDLVKTWLVG